MENLKILPTQRTFIEQSKNTIPPIRMCIDNRESEQYTNILKLRETAQDVNFCERYQPNVINVQERGFISDISEINKYSEGYFDCTGLIVSALDKDTRKPISFLTHQATGNHPVFIDEFKEVLTRKLQTLKDRALPGTIDSVMFGGRGGTNYNHMITLLSDLVGSETGVQPVILQGPNLGSGVDEIFYDTTDKRLYMFRDSQPDDMETNEPFTIEEMKDKKWYTE